MSPLLGNRRSALRGMAASRLLDPSPAAVERLEQAITGAISVGKWSVAKRLLVYRRKLSDQVLDSREAQALHARLAELLEVAIARKIPADASVRSGQ